MRRLQSTTTIPYNSMIVISMVSLQCLTVLKTEKEVIASKICQNVDSHLLGPNGMEENSIQELRPVNQCILLIRFHPGESLLSSTTTNLSTSTQKLKQVLSKMFFVWSNLVLIKFQLTYGERPTLRMFHQMQWPTL